MIRKTALIILLTVFLIGCFPDRNKELVRTAFEAGWWCNEKEKSLSECMVQLNNLPSMR